MPHIKEQLYLLCCEYVSSREQAIRKIIEDVREAVGNETKSSAGDKYETSRETMQQEINLNLSRLNELAKLRQTLERIMPGNESETAIPGSIVYTSHGNYYLAISAGVQKVEGIAYYAVSAASPIGELLLGKKKGSVFTFNGKSYSVHDVV